MHDVRTPDTKRRLPTYLRRRNPANRGILFSIADTRPLSPIATPEDALWQPETVLWLLKSGTQDLGLGRAWQHASPLSCVCDAGKCRAGGKSERVTGGRRASMEEEQECARLLTNCRRIGRLNENSGRHSGWMIDSAGHDHYCQIDHNHVNIVVHINSKYYHANRLASSKEATILCSQFRFCCTDQKKDVEILEVIYFILGSSYIREYMEIYIVCSCSTVSQILQADQMKQHIIISINAVFGRSNQGKSKYAF